MNAMNDTLTNRTGQLHAMPQAVEMERKRSVVNALNSQLKTARKAMNAMHRNFTQCPNANNYEAYQAAILAYQSLWYDRNEAEGAYRRALRDAKKQAKP